MTQSLAERYAAPAPIPLHARGEGSCHARITPHRWLSNGAMMVLSLTIMAVSLALQVIFLVNGFWPISVFFSFEPRMHASHVRETESCSQHNVTPLVASFSAAC